MTLNVESLVSRLKLNKCILCKEKRIYSRRKSLLLHFNMFHIQKCITIGKFTLLCCRLYCDGATHCHYHCPVCSYTSPRVRLINEHLKEHPHLFHCTNNEENSTQALKRFNKKLQLKLTSDASKKFKTNDQGGALRELNSNFTENANTQQDVQYLCETKLLNGEIASFHKIIGGHILPTIDLIKIEEPVVSESTFDCVSDKLIKLEAENDDMLATTFCSNTTEDESVSNVQVKYDYPDTADDVYIHQLNELQSKPADM